MELTLLARDDDSAHVECRGTITLIDVEGKQPLEDLLGPGGDRKNVLLNLEKITYIDTGAVSWFINCHKNCLKAGGSLVLHSASPMVLQLLELLRMDKFLHLARDEAQAHAIAKGAKQ